MKSGCPVFHKSQNLVPVRARRYEQTSAAIVVSKSSRRPRPKPGPLAEGPITLNLLIKGHCNIAETLVGALMTGA